MSPERRVDARSTVSHLFPEQEPESSLEEALAEAFGHFGSARAMPNPASVEEVAAVVAAASQHSEGLPA